MTNDLLYRAKGWLKAEMCDPNRNWAQATALLDEFARLEGVIREKDALIARLADDVYKEGYRQGHADGSNP